MRVPAALPLLLVAAVAAASEESGTRLLRQPDISATQIVFVYGGDLWTASRSGEGVRRLTRTPEAESYPRFSPDGRLVAFTRLGDVYVMPAGGGPERRLTWHPQLDTALGWTPDGRHIVMESDRWKGSFDVAPHVFLLPVEGGWPEPLPAPRASHASFSAGGRFAYGPAPEVVLFQSWRKYRGGSLGYIATFDPASKTYTELPRGRWNDVAPMWRGDSIYFLSDRDAAMNLYRHSLSSRKTTRLTEYREWDVRNAGAAADAIVYENGGWLYTLDLATLASRRVPIAMPQDALPSAEEQARWRKALEDAWRNYKERAFRPAARWDEIKPRYLDLMKWAAHWSDADAVLRQMLAEAGQSHLILMRPEPEAPPSKTGLLGANFRIENGRYRIAKIYAGGPLPDDVREGDYVLAVNGNAVPASKDICFYLDGLAGSSVRLSVSASPAGPAREIPVQPTADERGLRYEEWVRANAARVAAAGDGRIGYVHLVNVDESGVERFRREWIALRGKADAVIIDVRNNSGGTQPFDILDWIERPPMRMMFDRRGEVPPMKSPFIDGPKVMIANEQAVSGGDEMAFYFKSRKIGTLVGTRTMGGMIGTAGMHEVAGGWLLAIPEFGFFWPQFGQWAPENLGVEPDITVEWTPADAAAGRDPQLEKAIAVAVGAIATWRKQVPDVPKAPY